MSLDRTALRQANERPSVLETSESLTGDASLKKNTSYLKRIRTALPAAEHTDALIREVAQLRLDKYLSELVTSVAEGCSRVKVGVDVASAVKVVSALHQQYGFEAFTGPLLQSLTSQCKLPPKNAGSASITQEQREKEDSSRVSRQRALLRLIADMDAVGLVRIDAKRLSHGHVTLQLLQDLLLASDKDLLLQHASIALSITKHCSFMLPPSSDPTPQEQASSGSATVLIASEVQTKCSALLHTFYGHLSTRAIKERSSLLSQEKANNEAYIRHGELFEDRKANFDKLVARWDKLWAALQSLAEALHAELPNLPEAQDDSAGALGLVVSAGQSLAQQGAAGEDGVLDPRFTDEEEMRFYCNLKDLHAGVSENEVTSTVPEGEDDEAKEGQPDAAAEESATQESEAKLQAESEPPSEPAAAPEGEAEAEQLPAGPAARLSSLLTRLPEMTSQNFIDDAAMEFSVLNSKAARNRLVKFLHSTSSNRTDLLPFYGRLVATLRPVAPEIATGLLACLEDDFRYLHKRKNIELRDRRNKTMRFLSELTKFSLIPPHAILHCFKVLVDDLTHFNVDSFSILLEGCGRFVFRNEPTHVKMASLLEIFLRKKAAQNLDARQVSMLESAYYQVNPPERAAIVRRERTPMELFIHHVCHRVLTRSNYPKALLLLRKLDWQDAEVRHRLFNSFTKIWKAKYSNIALFALLVYDLGKYHSDFSVGVADRVLENIRLGLERNNFKHNQRRVASIKYLGELYNFQSVDAKVILDCLWLLTTFGHPNGQPHPDHPTALDAPSDWFRVRLVCTLLDTTYTYLDKGNNKARLDNFLTFFQLYVQCKTHPPPMDIDFMLSDTLETVRPKARIFKSFEEAAEAVQSMLTANAVSPPAVDPEEDEEEEDGSEASSHRDLDSNSSASSTSSDSDSDEQPDGDEESGSDSGSAVSDEVHVKNDKPGLTEEEEAEFARDLAKMMSDSGANKSLNARANLDVGLPLLRRDGSAEVSQDHMTFNLLTKRGARPQVRAFEIPTEAAIASRSREQQQQRLLEQQQVKELVLQSERRQQSLQEEDDVADLEATLARRGFKTRTKNGG